MATAGSFTDYDRARLCMYDYLRRNGFIGHTFTTYYNAWKEYLRWCRRTNRNPTRSADDFLLTHVNNAYYYALKHGYEANKWPFKVHPQTVKRIRRQTEKPPSITRLEKLPQWEELDTLLTEFPKDVPLDPSHISSVVMENKLRPYFSEKHREIKLQRLNTFWLFLFFQTATGMRFYDAYHIHNVVSKSQYIALTATTKGGYEKNYMIRKDLLRKHMRWMVPHFQRARELLHELYITRGDLIDLNKLLVASGDQAQLLSYSTAYLQYYELLHYTWNKAMADKTTTPHDLRRAIITTLLRKGAPLPAVQRFVQHKKVTTTARYYVGGGEDALRWLS